MDLNQLFDDLKSQDTLALYGDTLEYQGKIYYQEGAFLDLTQFSFWDSIQNIIEVGCGTSVFLDYYDKDMKEKSYLGLDLEEYFIKKSKHKYNAANREFEQVNFLDYKVQNLETDMFVFFISLQHIKDMPATLKQINKVLNAGGYIYIQEVKADNHCEYIPALPFYESMIKDIDRIKSKSIRNRNCLDEFQTLAIENGYETLYESDPVIEVKDINNFVNYVLRAGVLIERMSKIPCDKDRLIGELEAFKMAKKPKAIRRDSKTLILRKPF